MSRHEHDWQLAHKLCEVQIHVMGASVLFHSVKSKSGASENRSYVSNHLYCKVETPYHDNDLIMTPIRSPQSGWQWTSSCPELHMGSFSDGGWQFKKIRRCH